MTTEPLPTVGPPGGKGGNRRLTVILSVAGGVLLLALVALAFMLGRSLAPSEGPAAPPPPPAAVTPTPSAPSEPGPTAAPDPGDDGEAARFTRFDAKTEVRCGDSGKQPEIKFSWKTENAVEVWFSPGDGDAADEEHLRVPLSGDQRDLEQEPLFPCGEGESQDYTLTLVDADGVHLSGTWTVVDVDWDDDED